MLVIESLIHCLAVVNLSLKGLASEGISCLIVLPCHERHLIMVLRNASSWHHLIRPCVVEGDEGIGQVVAGSILHACTTKIGGSQTAHTEFIADYRI